MIHLEWFTPAIPSTASSLMNINADAAKDIPCKNVLIYGHCKFENKGCVFAHPHTNAPVDDPSTTTPPNATKNASLRTTPAMAGTKKTLLAAETVTTSGGLQPAALKLDASDAKRRFNMNTPSFQPSTVQSLTGKFAGLSPKLKEIPVFVPSGMDTQSSSADTSGAPQTYAARKFNASTPSFTPASPYDGGFNFDTAASASEGYQLQSTQNQPQSTPMHAPTLQPPKQQNPYLPNASGGPASAANALSSNSDFMYHNQNALTYPLNYHLYAPAPPPRLQFPLSAHETNANNLFIPNDLRELLTKKNEATLQSLGQLSLPEHVGVYHSLVPIDSNFDQQSKVYHLPHAVYKVMSNVDGLPYALRRIDYSSRLRILNELPFQTIKKWRALKNANIVGIQDVFTSVDFGTNGEPTLCMAYEYYPLANTLQEQHITRKLAGKLEPITELVLWNYLVQITNALLAIHEAGLYAGSTISMSKILVTNKNRVRLGAVAVDDILNFEDVEKQKDEQGTFETIKALQRADIARFGKLITELASATLPVSLRGAAPENLITSLRNSSSVSFSEDLLGVLGVLNSATEEFDLAKFFQTYLSQRTLMILNGLQDLSDYFEAQLLSEVENGRLFRLLAKINFLINRREVDGELGGSIYVIKLFRDFVFQMRDAYGKPVVDLSRVLVNLNKLDVGVDEKILLISSEEDSCMLVSYKEVKDIIDLSFRAVFR